MTDFTLNDLLKFTQNESKMVEHAMPFTANEEAGPSDEILQNILAYSKVLSVRKSSHLGTVHTVLN